MKRKKIEMNYLSVCSGIEAASVAFHPLGWGAVAFSEIEPFPSAVLAQRYPEVSNLGDMIEYEKWNLQSIDLLIGGTPCQSFSVAGQRKSLEDERGNLCLVFCRIADKFNPRWVMWENVPGVLSSKDNAFGCFLGELCGADSPLHSPDGGRWADCGVVSGQKRTVAWRVLDAQWFGVAQRRRRVFVLASRGYRNFECADVLLPVGESLPRYFKESGGKRDKVAKLVGECAKEPRFVLDYASYNCGSKYNRSFGLSSGDIAPTLVAKGPSVVCMAGNIIGRTKGNGGNGRGFSSDGVSYTLTTNDIHCVCYENHGNDSRVKELTDGVSNTLTSRMGTGGGNVNLVLHILQDPISGEEVAPCLGSASQASLGVFNGYSVRRLMPIECERLQGFPDNWTRISWRGKSEDSCPESPRYKAIGNSMAVPVVHWIGKRIQQLKERNKNKEMNLDTIVRKGGL